MHGAHAVEVPLGQGREGGEMIGKRSNVVNRENVFDPVRNGLASRAWQCYEAPPKAMVRSGLSGCSPLAEGLDGGVAQLGERLNGIQEVKGSIPFISTKRPASRQAFCI